MVISLQNFSLFSKNLLKFSSLFLINWARFFKWHPLSEIQGYRGLSGELFIPKLSNPIKSDKQRVQDKPSLFQANYSNSHEFPP